MPSRAKFEGWKVPNYISLRGPFTIEVYKHDKKWRSRTIPLNQNLSLPALRSEQAMQATVAAQFEKCIEPWAQVVG